MLRKLLVLLIAVLMLTPLASAATERLNNGLTVIGAGTAASCTNESAANAFSNAVAAGGAINFNCGPNPVTIIVNTNVTDKTVVVDGGGLITLSGENLRQIFLVMGSGDLTLRNLTLRDGNGFSGAAISISSAQAKASLTDCFLTGNDSGNTDGGAIYNGGVLTVTHSILSNNHSNKAGGAIYSKNGTVAIHTTTFTGNQAFTGGAVNSRESALRIEQSLFSQNIANNLGGGLYNDLSTTYITNTTFYENRALGGGGIYARGNYIKLTNATLFRNYADTGGAIWRFSGGAESRNSIFVRSRSTADAYDSLNCDGPTMTTLGRNIVGDGTCFPNPSGVDKMLTNARMEPALADNGGPTLTLMPFSNSPALGYAQFCPPVDQRGAPRPIGTGCDSGAVEYGTLFYIPWLAR
jgi:predicted outer membrane repeat protein